MLGFELNAQKLLETLLEYWDSSDFEHFLTLKLQLSLGPQDTTGLLDHAQTCIPLRMTKA